MRKVGVVVVAIAVQLLMSCGSDPKGLDDNFDRTKILVNLTDQIILPAWEDFESATAVLKSRYATFQANLDEESLSELQTSWFTARIAWKNCEPFKFGPLESSGLENEVDLWPANATGIESAIDAYDGSDSYLIKIGSDRKGFAGLEYLLFSSDVVTTLELFKKENRMIYLGLLVDALSDIAVQMHTTWRDDYAAGFKEDIGNDAGASTTLLANELIYHIEVTKNYRVETPLGIRSGSSVPLPETLESYYAHQSKALIAQSLEITHQVFAGGDGSGFDDYLDELNIQDEENKLLSQVIFEQIALCETDLEEIDGSLADALEYDIAAVEKLYVDLKELTLLIKTDMMSQLGLLVVFSDNDGD